MECVYAVHRGFAGAVDASAIRLVGFASLRWLLPQGQLRRQHHVQVVESVFTCPDSYLIRGCLVTVQYSMPGNWVVTLLYSR